MMKTRCRWASDLNDSIMIAYHDNEYGEMIDDEAKLFELLSLELMQTGLSWKIILDKRKAFNCAFYNFDCHQVAKMSQDDIISLLNNKDIVRHRLKIEAIINNAQNIVTNNINLQTYFSNKYQEFNEDYVKCAKQFKKDGFKFIGPSVIESLFKALGYIEAHDKVCYKYKGE